MVHTASAASLLHAAIQDIVAAKRLQVERLPGLARASGEALAPLIEAEAALASRQAERLVATGLDAGGPSNLWMAGVLDDAERDAGAHQAGRLRDIARWGRSARARPRRSRRTTPRWRSRRRRDWTRSVRRWRRTAPRSRTAMRG